MDSSEVKTREKWEIRKNDKTEMGVRGKEGIVKPVAEGIGTGSRIRGRERISDGGVGEGGGEEREGRAVGISEGHERIRGRRREDGSEGMDAGASLGNRFPPGVHWVVGGGGGGRRGGGGGEGGRWGIPEGVRGGGGVGGRRRGIVVIEVEIHGGGKEFHLLTHREKERKMITLGGGILTA